MSRRKSIIEVGILGLLILILAVVVVTYTQYGFVTRERWYCTNNLGRLSRLLEIYRRNFGGPDLELPRERGEAFWLKLAQVGLIETANPGNPTDATILHCPIRGSSATTCDYRGPALNVNLASDYLTKDPIGGDKINADGTTNHGTAEKQGVNQLTKGNQVQKITLQDPVAWTRYLEKTK